MSAVTVPEWTDRAACLQVDPDLFFPDAIGGRRRAQATREARAVCQRCEVAAACLTFALSNGERFGVWAGKDFERSRG